MKGNWVEPTYHPLPYVFWPSLMTNQTDKQVPNNKVACNDGHASIPALDIPKKISHVFRYLTWSQIPVKTSIWHTLRKKTKSLEPLAYERIAIVFQPTARASPAHTKTNRRSAHRLEALEIWFFFSMCAKWMSPSESDFMLNIQWHEEIFETSRVGRSH